MIRSVSWNLFSSGSSLWIGVNRSCPEICLLRLKVEVMSIVLTVVLFIKWKCTVLQLAGNADLCVKKGGRSYVKCHQNNEIVSHLVKFSYHGSVLCFIALAVVIVSYRFYDLPCYMYIIHDLLAWWLDGLGLLASYFRGAEGCFQTSGNKWLMALTAWGGWMGLSDDPQS